MINSQALITVPKVKGVSPLLFRKPKKSLLVSRKTFYDRSMSSGSESTSLCKFERQLMDCIVSSSSAESLEYDETQAQNGASAEN